MSTSRIAKALALAGLLVAGGQAQALVIGVFQGGSQVGTITPYAGGTTGAVNYGYSSASAHPLIGPTPTTGQAFLWFFQGSDGLSFNVFAGKDNSGTCGGGLGLCEQLDLDIAINGSTTDPGVLLSDDGSELTEPLADMFQMRGNFANNTDGGVMGAIGGSAWEVVVDPLQWVSHDGTNFGTFMVSAIGPSGSVALGNGTGSPADQIIFRPVPEPAPLALLALALPLVMWVARRQN